MSKLIVEMEMPRNCDECEVNYDCAFCGITGSAFYGNTQMPNFMPDEQKLPDCPIKGVLPEQHGRLIDEAVFCENVVKYSHQSTKTIGKALNATPTIIEMTPIVAERKDDEQTGSNTPS